MNHIYRSLYNKALGTWVAVPEIAKTHGKSAGGKSATFVPPAPRFAITALAGAFLLASGQVMAATGNKYPVPNGNGDNYCYYDTGSQSVVCGDNTTSVTDTYDNKKAKSIAVGLGAKTTGESNVAVGANSSAAKTAATALGASAKAMNDYGVAIGFESVANNTWDISIGRRAGADAVATGDGRNIAIGDGALKNAKNANNNTVLGTSTGDSLNGSHNIAMGAYANSPTANNGTAITANNTIAIGERAVASSGSSVAIGTRVKASGAISNAIGTSAEASGAYAIANGYGALASGKNAVAIGSAREQIDAKVKATGNNAIAIGSVRTEASGTSSIAIGEETKASGLNSVSVGKYAGQVASDATVAQLSQTVNVGYRAGYGTKRNIHGIAIGNGAGEAVDSPSGQNVALGNAAGSRVKGNTNVAISARAGQDVEGHDNFAALVDAGRNIKGNNNIAIGKDAGRGVAATNTAPAVPLEVSNTIAMGFEAKGTHNDTIALGQKAKAQVEDSIAIGRGVTTELLQGDTQGNREGMIAIGSETTKASGKAAVAIGRNAQSIGRGAVTLGDASKAQSGQGIAIGAQANVTANSAGGIAMGSLSNSAAATAVAIGTLSDASVNHAVALGRDSQANRAALTPNATTSATATAAANQVYALMQASQADKDAISATVKGSLGAVSVGTTARTGPGNANIAAATRQITNVAAGSEDSDAVNVAQLKAVANQVASAKTHYYSVNTTDQNANSNYNNDGAKGLDSLAAGVRVEASRRNGVAIGSDAIAAGSESLALGNNVIAGALQPKANPADPDVVDPSVDVTGATAVGNNSRATATGAQAFGQSSKATALNAAAIGRLATASGERASAFGVGNTASGASSFAGGDRSNAALADSIAIGKLAKTTGTGSGAVAIGRNAHADGQGSTSMGINARSANQSIAIGTNANNPFGTAGAIGNSSVAIGNNTNAAGENTVALGNQSTATGSKATALGFDTKAQGQSSVVIGDSARNERATGNASYPDADQAVVVGVSSNVNSLGGIAIGSTTKTTGVYGTAVGIGSVNNADFGVALGALSTTDSNIVVNRDGYDPLNPTGTADAAILATKANAAGVSVGGRVLSRQGSAPGQTAVRPNGVNDGDIIRRQIHNVAAGTDDTDAVNVAQLKAVANKIATTPLTVTDGKVTAPAAGSPDASKLATAGDIANAINSSGFTLTAQGEPSTASLVNPGETVDLRNSDGNIVIHKDSAANNTVTFDLAPIVTIGPDAAAGGKPITIDGTAGTISGLSGTLPATTSTAPSPTTAQAAPALTPAQNSNAATVGDVLNAGWNLQGNGTAKDFVRAYDTVNFVNGNGTTVTVDSDGATSTIKVDVNAQGLAESAQLPVVYTKADGSKVYKHSDGKFYDKPEGQAGAVEVPTANVIASMQNANGSTTAPTTLANIKAGVNDNDAVNVAQLNAAKTHFYSVNNTDATAGNYNNDGATGANALAAGVGATATGISATAVGHGATAGAEFAVAVGLDAQATASGAMAFGNGAQATGQDSLAHGKASKATGNYATAVGNAASAGLHATAVGNGAAASGNYATSFGTGSAATGGGSAALGNDAKATEWAAVAVGRDAQASNTAAVAIGEGARAAHEHSVALGSGSATAVVDNTGRASATVGGITYSGFAATDPTSMVSVGRDASQTPPGEPPSAINRTITHVAAGRINATSTDAINGSQLHATQTVIGNVANSMDTILGGNATVGGDGNLSMSDIGGTGKNNIHDAIASIKGTADQAAKPLKFKGDSGDTVVASPDDTVTIKGGETDSTKLSNGNNIGVDAKDGTDTLNIKLAKDLKDLKSAEFTDTAGNETKVDGNGVTIDPATPGKPDVSLTKDGLDNGGNKITHVADGEISANSTDAVNGSQLFALQQRPPVVNNITQVINNTTVSAGDNMQVIQQGDNYEVTIAPDIHLHSVTTGPVTMDAGGVSYDGHYYIDANGLNANGRVIREVAAGRIAPDSTDAVNGAQLHALGHQVDNRLGKLENALGDVDKRARAGIASAMASAGLPQAYRPGASMVAASAAHYDGQSAVAIGASTISDNGRWILKGTLNVNSKDAGASVGVGYQW